MGGNSKAVGSNKLLTSCCPAFLSRVMDNLHNPVSGGRANSKMERCEECSLA